MPKTSPDETAQYLFVAPHINPAELHEQHGGTVFSCGGVLADMELAKQGVKRRSRSQHPPISANPAFHVLHDIDKPDKYLIGGEVFFALL